MMLFEIKKEDIERLDPLSLTQLMKKLLRTELSKLKLRQTELVLSLDINDPDGGLDGYIGCLIPENHPWLPQGRSGWQFKAVKRFPRSQVEKEVLNADKTDVKERIKILLANKETYVLVIGGRDYTPNKLEEKEQQIKNILQDQGYPENEVKIYSSGQVADWVDSNPSVVAHFKPNRTDFKDIEQWQKTTRVINEPRQFVYDKKREEILRSIRETIISNQKGERATVIRLVGFQGVGKTRLIYEVLNTNELRHLILYTESPEKLPRSRFNEIAANQNIIAILVIDECPHDTYVQLAKEAEGIGGRMTLVTLDFDKDKPSDPEDMHVVLEPLDKDASDELIQLTVPGLPRVARMKIADFSRGYPRIAVLLAENFSHNPNVLLPSALEKLGITDLFDRIIAGRYDNATIVSKIRAVLTVIALFGRLGWDDEVAFQGKKACMLLGINWKEARQIAKEQQDRGLITKRGRYRYVTPLPLAIYLSSEWWAAMDKSGWMMFYKELPDSETKMAFLERLKDLPHLEHAKAALAQIFSAFKYELLDDINGSRIFYGLAKADHLFAMETLERILGNLPREKLLSFKMGRGNAVRSLERIACWQDTFHRAARLLLKLADAENEPWSNNATGTFTRLFQTFLGGTSTPAWERHPILKEALDSGNKSLQRLALKGLNAVFNLRYAIGTLIGEEQGSIIPPPEWNPKSQEDQRKAVLSALGLLDKAMDLSDPELRAEAATGFLSHVRVLLAYRFEDEVISRLKSIRGKFPELEKELIRTVENVIHYDSKNLGKEVIDAVRHFRKELIGDQFNGLMRRYVKSRLLEDQLKENRENVEKIVRQLVEESIRSPDKLEDQLEWLVTNEAENGYVFGRILGELDTEYYWLNTILNATKESENPSAFFLGGYLSSIKSRDEDLWTRTLEGCYSDETLGKLLLEIIWRSGASDKSVRLLIKLLKDQKIKPQEMRLFLYGAWFSGVSEESFLEFLRVYYEIEDGKYAPIIIGVIQQFADSHPRIIENAADILLKYLTQPGIFMREHNGMTLFYWDILSSKLMDRLDDTIPCFMDQILHTLKRESDFRLEPYFRKKIKFFLRKNVEGTWKKLGEALLKGDLRAWRLIHLLKGGYANFETQEL